MRLFNRKKKRVIVDRAVITFEQKFRELARVHSLSPKRSFTLDGEWLGWGGKQSNLYLRVTIPQDFSLPESELETIAGQLALGLNRLNIPNVISQRLANEPIDTAECEKEIARFRQWMLRHGWTVTIDAKTRTMTQSRLPGSAKKLSPSELEEIVRAQQEVGPYITQYRVVERVLSRSEGIDKGPE